MASWGCGADLDQMTIRSQLHKRVTTGGWQTLLIEVVRLTNVPQVQSLSLEIAELVRCRDYPPEK